MAATRRGQRGKHRVTPAAWIAVTATISVAVVLAVAIIGVTVYKHNRN